MRYLMRSRRFVLLVAFAALLVCIWDSTLLAAPQAELWGKWGKSDSNSNIRVDHSFWDGLLQEYLDTNHASGINRFAYSKVTSAGKQRLARYLDYLQGVRVTRMNRKEQMAYWINLYNAATVKLMLDHYPVSSIRNIKKPWDTKLVNVEGEDITLNDIEHRILRPIWRDNRVHYAVNCASLGCPNLQPTAFTAEKLEILLDKSAREYINHQRGVQFKGERLHGSSIFQWYKSDFGGSTDSLVQHLLRYAKPGLAQQLKGYRGKISYSYDWSINGQ